VCLDDWCERSLMPHLASPHTSVVCEKRKVEAVAWHLYYSERIIHSDVRVNNNQTKFHAVASRITPRYTPHASSQRQYN